MSQDKAAAAIAFIKFMSSADSQAKVADKLGLLPTRKSAYDKVTNPVIISLFKPVMEVAVERAWVPRAASFGPLDEAATKIYIQGVAARTRWTPSPTSTRRRPSRPYSLG